MKNGGGDLSPLKHRGQAQLANFARACLYISIDQQAANFIFYFGDITLRKKKMKNHSFFSQNLV
jgi:hypothetical protein